MMGDGDLLFRDREESEAGEDLTDGGKGERGRTHEVRCFDSFNIQVFKGSDQMVCHLDNRLPDPGGA